MRMEGRRESSNVEDRRGQKVAMAAGGLGIGGIIIYLLISFLGGDPSAVQSITNQTTTQTEQTSEPYQEEGWEEELRVFSSRVLAGTEDVWTKLFKEMGKTYQPPKLVFFKDAVRSGCGDASSAGGPFYCSADERVYIDLEFFKNMKQELGADGDFAYAYVIAHEVGHHVQNQLGILGPVHQKRAELGKDNPESNKLTVRLELQADYFAGIWAYYDNQMFSSIEDGDVEEALNAAAKIGDDYLQKQAYGRTMPETFTHGTSEQRSRWLKKGIHIDRYVKNRPITAKDILTAGGTFDIPYENL